MCVCVYICTIETIPYVQARNMYVHQKSDEPTKAQTNRRLERGQCLGISQSTFLHLTRQTIRRREKVRYWRNSTRNIEASVIETGEILAFFTATRCLLYKRRVFPFCSRSLRRRAAEQSQRLAYISSVAGFENWGRVNGKSAACCKNVPRVSRNAKKQTKVIDDQRVLSFNFNYNFNLITIIRSRQCFVSFF